MADLILIVIWHERLSCWCTKSRFKLFFLQKCTHISRTPCCHLICHVMCHSSPPPPLFIFFFSSSLVHGQSILQKRKNSPLRACVRAQMVQQITLSGEDKSILTTLLEVHHILYKFVKLFILLISINFRGFWVVKCWCQQVDWKMLFTF